MGVTFAAITEAAAVELLLKGGSGGARWMITANLDHVRQYQTDPAARRVIDAADAVVADGTPLVWASRIAGTPLPQRVAGSNMVSTICAAASKTGQSVFFLGGEQGVAASASDILQRRYPGLRIAGTYCPPMGFERDADEMARIRSLLSRERADIVLVGLGFPKQDVVIEGLREPFPTVTFVGVGIAFSYVAGTIVRAPQWTHRLSLEWLFRLKEEPRRLARRYLVDGLPFAARLMICAILRRVGRMAGRPLPT